MEKIEKLAKRFKEANRDIEAMLRKGVITENDKKELKQARMARREIEDEIIELANERNETYAPSDAFAVFIVGLN